MWSAIDRLLVIVTPSTLIEEIRGIGVGVTLRLLYFVCKITSTVLLRLRVGLFGFCPGLNAIN